MNILTTHVRPPIPLRGFEWSAINEATYEAGEPIGWGETEQQAINDLLEKLHDE